MTNDRVYVIGDIHGHIDKLQEVHGWIERDQSAHGAATIVHVGDLTDRGPKSAQVVDYLASGMDAGEDWVVLKGNHDRMFSWYLQDPPKRDHILRREYEWLHPRLGGYETLESYGVDMSLDGEALHEAACRAVPERHKGFLNALPLSHSAAGAFIVHAGIRPGVALGDQKEDDLIWIRDQFHLSRADHGPLVVHGHTPVEEVFHYGNRVNIDTGAAYGGPLSAIVIENRVVSQITKRGRRAIEPPRR